MQVRHYQPGDEVAQAAIYNRAAGGLPAFKPATAEEITRRYRASDPDSASRSFALEGDEIIGYAVWNRTGRISYPWCLPGAEHARKALLENACAGLLQAKGTRQAWTAYRADWQPVLDFFREHGFRQVREMVNYVAELERLPQPPLPAGVVMISAGREEIAETLGFAGGLFEESDTVSLSRFFLENPYFQRDCLFGLKEAATGQTLGLGLAITDGRFADPTKLDAAMPCFRLGALGTERERHKRINGLFSCVFSAPAAGEALLSEAVRRFENAGLTHAAAQAPSDQPEFCAYYDRYFRRQGAFPILARDLRGTGR